MMQGVVSLLADADSARVDALCQELAAVGSFYARSILPHFTYQVAERYELTAVESALCQLAAATTPFDITTSGLGIFTGERPVLYVRIVRDPALNDFHTRVWQSIAPYVTEPHDDHYAPKHWIPHITLAARDLTHDGLAEAVRLLSERSFRWTLRVDNLALVPNADEGRNGWQRIPFGRG